MTFIHVAIATACVAVQAFALGRRSRWRSTHTVSRCELIEHIRKNGESWLDSATALRLTGLGLGRVVSRDMQGNVLVALTEKAKEI